MPISDSSREPQSTFDRTSGLPCLDFINTLNGRSSGAPEDRLVDYATLVHFVRESGLLPATTAAALGNQSILDARGAAESLARARTFRETCYRILTAVAGGRVCGEADLELLNRVLTKALSRSVLVPSREGFTWEWPRHEIGLDRPLLVLAREIADFLTSPQLGALRICASPSCEVLFLDGSRNRRRKWCDMKICGNRAKARRHYARRRKSQS